jgi:uncharacterized protein YbaR (Trm112 family)
MSCPKCITPLENYTKQEGGWCPKCEEWYPADIIREWLEENEPADEADAYDGEDFDYE